MPLILAPSFDDHTREEVEAHLEQVRLRRIAPVLEYQQGKLLKLEGEGNDVENKLIRAYSQLGRAIIKLDNELDRVEKYAQLCQTLMTEVDLVHDRISLQKGKK